jgi:hypothetical protein
MNLPLPSSNPGLPFETIGEGSLCNTSIALQPYTAGREIFKVIYV